MTRRIDKVAKRFELKLGNNGANSDLVKNAARGKKQVSRKGVAKRRDKSRQTYQKLRTDLTRLEAERDKLDAELKDMRKGLLESRSDMLKTNDILNNMDLVDCNYVVYYNNTDDVGYVVDKEEHYLSVDDEGSPSLTLVKERNRADRAKKREEQGADDSYADDEEDSEEDSNDASDGLIGFNGNSIDFNDIIDTIPGIGRLEDPAAPRSEEEFTEGRFPSRHPNLRFPD
jgi:hypothetical protein